MSEPPWFNQRPLEAPLTDAVLQRESRNAPTPSAHPEWSGGLTEALLNEGAPSAARNPASRIALLDNAKAALIYCVVLYHISVVYTGADRPESPVAFASGFLMLLKPVVMPGFCLISGHVSRVPHGSWTLASKHTRGLYQLIATYVVFQTLFYLNDMWSFTYNDFPFPALPVQVFAPPRPAVTWFLVAIVVWRMTLPGFVLMRLPLLTALVLGLGSLYVDLGLNYQNLFSFLPYFVGGHLLPASAWDQLGRPALRLGLAACFVGTTLALACFSAYGGRAFQSSFLASCISYGCFTGALPTPPAGAPPVCSQPKQLALRALFYVASVPLLAGFLCCLPRRRGLWTYPGYMSMYIYLLHPLIISNPIVMRVVFSRLTDIYGVKTNVWSPTTEPSAVCVMPLAALLVTVLLALPTTRWPFHTLVEPKLSWLFTPESLGARVQPAELLLSISSWNPPDLPPPERKSPELKGKGVSTSVATSASSSDKPAGSSPKGQATPQEDLVESAVAFLQEAVSPPRGDQ